MKLIQFDNLIITILIILIILIYLKKINFEQFNNYPISPDSYLDNNYTNDIEMDKLKYLKFIIKQVLIESNDGKKDIYNFNYSNLNIEKINPNIKLVEMVTNMLINSINSKLNNNKNLKLNDIKCIEHTIAGHEEKILFYLNTTYFNNFEEDNIKLYCELIYINQPQNKRIHLNKIDIYDISDEFIPGYNILNNDKLTLNDDKLILSDDKINNILENNINDDDFKYENNDSDINTEEAKSFFDM